MFTQRCSVIKIVCLTIAVGLLLAIAGCDSTPAQTTGPKPPAPAALATTSSNQPAKPQPTALPAVAGVAARVNGQEISLAAYQQMVNQFQTAMAKQGVDPNTPEGQARLAQVKQQILDSMIDDALIAQEAAKQGVAVSDADLDAAMQKIISDTGGQAKFEQILAASGQTLADARALQRTQMLDNLMRDRVLATVPKTTEQVHARHILVDSPAAAQALLAQLQAGADFGQLAQQSSQDSLTKANGGDLGWFSRGTLVAKEVEDAAFALQPGQVSNVVQSAFGYHLVQVLERDPARALEGDQLVKVQQIAVENWLNGLRAQAKVERLAGQ